MLFVLLFNAFGDADGTCRTDETAEVTAYTLGAYQAGTTRFSVEDDGLMTSVVARYLTAATTDALLLVKLRIDDGVTIQMVGIQELLQPLAHQFVQRRDVTLSHIALQTQYEVVDDAITILHHSGAHLHVTAAQLDEFQGVAPCLNAADSTELNLEP